jgi:hypothetical protein
MTAFTLSRHQVPRRLVAAIAVFAYAMPLMVVALSHASHGAFHFMAGAMERQAQAAALGLTHLGDHAGYTHTHDGVTHTHAGVEVIVGLAIARVVATFDAGAIAAPRALPPVPPPRA